MKDNTTETKRRASNGQIDFNRVLVDSVDETIEVILGVEVTAILWRHWGTTLGITRENASNHLPELFESIRTQFGAGGEIVGERIVKRLYMKADTPLEYSQNRPLVQCVRELKEILAKDTMSV